MQITFNINEDIIKKLKSKSKELGISRSRFVSECIKQYFEPRVEEQDGEVEGLEKENNHQKEVIKLLENNNKVLESQLGFLQGEYSLITQRMLEPPEKIKRRWKFWKK